MENQKCYLYTLDGIEIMQKKIHVIPVPIVTEHAIRYNCYMSRVHLDK